MGFLTYFNNSHSLNCSSVAKTENATTMDQKMPVLTPPLQLKDHHESTTKHTGIIAGLLDLFKGVGSDLTRFQVPVQFNMPKSQLQLYGEIVYCSSQDLLSPCVDSATQFERFLAVLRWHISTTRVTPFGKAPFNPVLGETHHVSVGDLHVFLEQVSHHPPVTALYATNEKKGIQLSFSHHASPRFYGSGVDVTVHGQRILKLSKHNETYEMTSPKLGFRFLPVPCTEWTGSTTVNCPETGLKAVLTFKNKSLFGFRESNRRVSGKVIDSQTGHTLYEVQGNWDQIVFLKEKSNGTTTILYDASAAIGCLKTPEIKNLHAISPMESSLVWSSVSEGILARDIDKARAAKTRVEENQRSLRKEKQSTWSPKFFIFSPSTGRWEWHNPGQPVPEAPIVVCTS